MKLSCKTVHEKYAVQAQIVLLKGRAVYWLNRIVLANQDCVDSSCFVASQSESLIVTAGS